MYILRTHGVLFALLISLTADTFAQGAPQPGGSPSQRSAPTTETGAQVLFTVSDDAGNPAPAPPRDSVRLLIDRQPAEIEDISSRTNSPVCFSGLVAVADGSQKCAD